MQTDVQPTGVTPRTNNTRSEDNSSVAATAPGQLRVIKRNGAVVSYDESKITVAITKAYLAVEGGNAAASSRIHESVAQLSASISEIFRRRMPSGGTIHIEDIQDQVELALMRSGEHKIARSYVIYRNEHARLREQKREAEKPSQPEIMVTLDDGQQGPLDTERLRTGELSEIAKVLRDLEQLRRDKDELSYGERQMLEQARGLVVQEVARVTGRDESEVADEVTALCRPQSAA